MDPNDVVFDSDRPAWAARRDQFSEHLDGGVLPRAEASCVINKNHVIVRMPEDRLQLLQDWRFEPPPGGHASGVVAVEPE